MLGARFSCGSQLIEVLVTIQFSHGIQEVVGSIPIGSSRYNYPDDLSCDRCIDPINTKLCREFISILIVLALAFTRTQQREKVVSGRRERLFLVEKNVTVSQ